MKKLAIAFLAAAISVSSAISAQATAIVPKDFVYVAPAPSGSEISALLASANQSTCYFYVSGLTGVWRERWYGNSLQPTGQIDYSFVCDDESQGRIEGAKLYKNGHPHLSRLREFTNISPGNTTTINPVPEGGGYYHKDYRDSTADAYGNLLCDKN